jgi:hypothetical protein
MYQKLSTEFLVAHPIYEVAGFLACSFPSARRAWGCLGFVELLGNHINPDGLATLDPRT